MAQHDYVIDNQSAASFRADINTALAAIVSNNSGATAPSTTYAHQVWADITAGLLKMRNAANSAWLTIGTLGATNLGLVPAASSGMRNLLINPGFTINQRGYVSGTAVAATGYTFDRWAIGAVGQSFTWTDSLGVRTVTVPTGAVYMMQQIIEPLSFVGTQTYTLSWAGTASGYVWQASTGYVSVANGGSVSLAGGASTAVAFTGGTVSNPQLEPGPVATAFERRPIALELAMCKRYFQYVPFNMSFSAASAGAGLEVGITWAEMRASPTVSSIQADPNTTQTSLNTSTALVARQTPYGGSCFLSGTAAGSAYTLGYRVSLTAEL
jgi:hypothetical protein